MHSKLSTAAEILGAALIVAAVATASWPAALAVAGVALIVFGFAAG